ncbi:MAG: hypothetical protein JJ846_007885 [Prochlorococcus marinus CUG1437]|nr:hypothetical protein [Prochlorococcus marinus CUG1437]
MNLKKYTNYLEKCYLMAREHNLKLVFSVHQTSSGFKQKSYTLPPRKTNKFLLSGVCNFNQEEIIEITSLYNSKIDYFLVDLEKKGVIRAKKNSNGIVTGNLEGRLSDIVPREKILGIRYDALTAEHVINLIVKNNPFIYKSNIGIIGLGKIGFKIGLSLLECGNNIEVFSRDFDLLYKKSACMDLIKPVSTLARPIPHRKIEACLNEKDIIITATTSKDVILDEHITLLNKGSVIYSIGHGEISKSALKIIENSNNIKICRIDIGLSIINYLERLIFVDETTPKLKIINGKRYVSGGYIGMPGDTVVDDVENPDLIYGFISNENNFIREMGNFYEK